MVHMIPKEEALLARADKISEVLDISPAMAKEMVHRFFWFDRIRQQVQKTQRALGADGGGLFGEAIVEHAVLYAGHYLGVETIREQMRNENANQPRIHPSVLQPHPAEESASTERDDS